MRTEGAPESPATKSPGRNYSVARSSHPVRRLLDGILGHDFFIAYGHGDGSAFPRALARGLANTGHSVFFDESGGYHGGDDIGEGTLRFAGNARRLVVVAGPHANASDWVENEVDASLANGRIQVLIDDPLQTVAKADAGHWTRLKLGHRKRLERAEGDTNLAGIVLDLEAGFDRFRRETRTVIAVLSAAIVLLSAMGLGAFLGYQREQARQEAETERGLALAGSLITQSGAALRDQPPRRQDAIQMATEAVTRIVSIDEPVSAPAEQALRDALAEIGGQPLQCGPETPPLVSAPVEVSRSGLLIGLPEGEGICIWQARYLTFVSRVGDFTVADIAWYRGEDEVWALTGEGTLLALHNVSGTGEELPTIGLPGFVKTDEFADLLGATEFFFLPDHVLQLDHAEDIMLRWDLPRNGTIVAAPIRFAVDTDTLEVFSRENRAIVTRPGNRTWCLLDLSTFACRYFPAPVARSADYLALSPDLTKIVALDSNGVSLVALDDLDKIIGLSTERLGDTPQYARFISDTGPVYVAGHGGTSVLWTPETNEIDRLPTTHSPLADAWSAESWLSPDGRWLILRDTLRATAGFRIDGAGPDEQRFYPIDLPFEAQTRSAIVGGALTPSPDGKMVAFGDTGTNAQVLAPGDASLAGSIRVAEGHDSVVTSLSFSLDGEWLFTVDARGDQRAWFLDQEAFGLLPIVQHTDPDNRLPLADAGAQGEEIGAFVRVNRADNPVLITGDRSLQVFDVIRDASESTIRLSRRQVRAGDLPPAYLPDSLAISAVFDADTINNARSAYFFDQANVVAAFGHRGASILRPGDGTGSPLLANDGEPWSANPSGAAADRQQVFGFSDNGAFCLADVGPNPPKVECWEPEDGSAKGWESHFSIARIGETRFAIDNWTLLQLDTAAGRYRTLLLDPEMLNCHTNAVHRERHLVFLCGNKLVTFDLAETAPTRRVFAAGGDLTAVVTSTDNNLAAASTRQGDLYLLDVNSPAIKQTGWGRLPKSVRIRAIAISPDGRVVTGDDSGTLWLWNAPGPSGEMAATTMIARHRGSVEAVDTFVVDGSVWAVSVGADQRVMVTPLDIDRLLAIARWGLRD